MLSRRPLQSVIKVSVLLHAHNVGIMPWHHAAVLACVERLCDSACRYYLGVVSTAARLMPLWGSFLCSLIITHDCLGV